MNIIGSFHVLRCHIKQMNIIIAWWKHPKTSQRVPCCPLSTKYEAWPQQHVIALMQKLYSKLLVVYPQIKVHDMAKMSIAKGVHLAPYPQGMRWWIFWCSHTKWEYTDDCILKCQMQVSYTNSTWRRAYEFHQLRWTKTANIVS